MDSPTWVDVVRVSGTLIVIILGLLGVLLRMLFGTVLRKYDDAVAQLTKTVDGLQLGIDKTNEYLHAVVGRHESQIQYIYGRLSIHDIPNRRFQDTHHEK